MIEVRYKLEIAREEKDAKMLIMKVVSLCTLKPTKNLVTQDNSDINSNESVFA